MQSASIYNTAEELGIEPWERDGLIALIGPLSRGELKVDMQISGVRTSCGTIACIGGHLGFQRGWDEAVVGKYVRGRKALHPLFYPECGSVGWWATGPQAARAIINYLTTGDPQWDAVMQGPSS